MTPRRPLVLTGALWKTLLGGTLTLALVVSTILPAQVEATAPERVSRLLGTALVYPPPLRTLRFSHALHPPGDYECKQCHAKAYTSTSAADRLRPTKADCVDCHEEANVPKTFGQPGDKTDPKTCLKCHVRVSPDGKVPTAKWPTPRLRFPHRIHVDRKVDCQACHAGVGKAGFGAKTHLPSMATCFTCHDGKPKSPSSRCTTCHERTAGGRIRTHFPEGSLKPGPSLPHLEHGPTFRKDHKVAARAHKGDCEQCHQQDTCLKCHGGIRRPTSIHAGNYILLHGKEARANRQRCTSCHTRQSFCQSCHSRTGVSKSNTKSPYQVPGVQKFHGQGWASSTNRSVAANRHATHARRNVGTCASCHKERDCMTCHARRRVGGLGHNPHGPGFRGSRQCRVLLQKNQRSCLKCHGWNDPLLSLCR